MCPFLLSGRKGIQRLSLSTGRGGREGGGVAKKKNGHPGGVSHQFFSKKRRIYLVNCATGKKKENPERVLAAERRGRKKTTDPRDDRLGLSWKKKSVCWFDRGREKNKGFRGKHSYYWRRGRKEKKKKRLEM